MLYDLVREGSMLPTTTLCTDIGLLRIVVSVAIPVAATVIAGTNFLDILLAIESQRLLTEDFRERLMDDAPPQPTNYHQHPLLTNITMVNSKPRSHLHLY
ncbi:hypothetical protein C0995_011095, partial [Termitomyces sp. Mi166